MLAEYKPHKAAIGSPTTLETARGTAKPPWQRRFLELLPSIQRHAKIRFRNLTPELRDELVQETIARALLDFVRLVERNKEHVACAGPLARFAVAQVQQGRRVGGRRNVRDVTSEYCRNRKAVMLESLNRYDEDSGNRQDLVVEDRNAGPAEVAATRLDVGDWLQTLTSRNRRLAERLAIGASTNGTARTFGITPGRVAQLRRQFHDEWCKFQGELDQATV
jgi:DNA-directed RNA polymerase specialized sigma24 family protein